MKVALLATSVPRNLASGRDALDHAMMLFLVLEKDQSSEGHS